MSEWNSFLSCSRDWAVVAQLRIPEKPLIKQQLWPTYVPLKSDLELQPANSENIKWRLSSTLSECLIANLISPDLTDLWAWAPQNLQTPTIRWLNFKFSLECSNLLIPSGNSSLETFKLSIFSFPWRATTAMAVWDFTCEWQNETSRFNLRRYPPLLASPVLRNASKVITKHVKLKWKWKWHECRKTENEKVLMEKWKLKRIERWAKENGDEEKA